MTVAELLAQSRAAHVTYRKAAGSIQRDGKVKDAPNYAATATAVREAQTARHAAHDLDPDHTDPAWRADAVAHATLLAFYAKYLSTP